MKLLRNKMNKKEYSDIVIVKDPDYYEIDAKKLNHCDLIQCPNDPESFVSGLREDGSVEYIRPGVKVEKNAEFYKNRAMEIKESYVKLQSAFNEVAKSVDITQAKCSTHRTN